MPSAPSQSPAELRPPPFPVLKGCGFLLVLGTVISVVSIAIGGVSKRLDVGSLLVLVAIFHWRTIINNMKRLYGQPTLLEKSEDAEDSTYRSPSTEQAFRVTAFYLPILVVVGAILTDLFEGDEKAFIALAAGAPAFLGIFTLHWRRKFRAIRFQQVQNARDELADALIDGSSETSSAGNHPLGDRVFFLYLRPFASTGNLLAVPQDAVNAAAIDLETRIADAVAYFGPLVALGRPGEARGAGRKAVSEHEWKLAIEQSGALASTIFVLPSIEEGIRWEIGLMRKRSWLDRAIFIQPPSTERFTSEWWHATRDFLQSEGIAAPAELFKDKVGLFTLLDDGTVERSEYVSSTVGISTLRQVLLRLGD